MPDFARTERVKDLSFLKSPAKDVFTLKKRQNCATKIEKKTKVNEGG